MIDALSWRRFLVLFMTLIEFPVSQVLNATMMTTASKCMKAE